MTTRQFNFMPSRYAGAAAPASSGPAPRPPARKAPAARRRRRAGESQADYRARRLIEGLGQLRIAGRHADDEVSAAALAAAFKKFGIPPEQGRAAYEAGQQDRASGVRCMCARCAG